MLSIGSVVDGKYRLLSEIGHGGMSVVYLAINERANKTWAIKEVRKDGGNDSEVVQQGLIAETEMLKKLHHRHLPSIADVIDREDSFLIVMDYIEGKSLQSIVTHNGPQSKENVIEWAKQLCDTLGYLHSRTPAIIYRDMKPANVMLNPDGKNVTLIDFGTAREYKIHSQGDTTWLGTRGYAAPEQFGGQGQTDARTDIYCLGATMYHLLTGKSPADTNFVIYPLGQLVPSLAGSGIEKIVAKCCEPNPADRYQNCAELMFDLENEPYISKAADRKRRLQLATFLLMCIFSVFSIAGMFVFSSLEKKATNRSYDYLLARASSVDMSNGIDSAMEYYRKAIGILPGRPQAYMALLDAADSDYKITIEENTAISNVILDTKGGTEKNIDKLEKDSPVEYADFAYRLANDYYFFYVGSDNKVKGANWYEKIKDNESLTDKQKNLANALYKIGSYYASLNSEKAVLSLGENSGNYRTFWDDMVKVTEGDVASDIGGSVYAVALYKEFVNQIYTHTQQFKAAGVSQDEMIAQLDKIDSALDSLVPENGYVEQQILDTKESITITRPLFEPTFAGGGE